MSDVILASVPCYVMLQIRSTDIGATLRAYAESFYNPQPLDPGTSDRLMGMEYLHTGLENLADLSADRR